MISQEFFEEAEYFLNLVLSYDQNTPDVYWGICLIKIRAKGDKDIANSKMFIKTLPEFNKYLALVPEDRRKKCISISKKQEKRFSEAKNKLSDDYAELLKKFEATKTGKGIFGSATMSISCLVSAILFFSIEVVFFGIILLLIGLICGFFAVVLLATLKENRQTRELLLKQIAETERELELYDDFEKQNNMKK